MAYQRIADGFVDHSTVLTAAHVQAMDKGIQEAWDGSGPENALWMDVFGNDDEWTTEQYGDTVHTVSKTGRTVTIRRNTADNSGHWTVNLTGAPNAEHVSRGQNFEVGNAALYDADFVPIPTWVRNMIKDPTSTKALRLRVRAEVVSLNTASGAADQGALALGIVTRYWNETTQAYAYSSRRLLCNLFSSVWTGGLTWQGDIDLACGGGVSSAENNLPLVWRDSYNEWAIYLIRRNKQTGGTVQLGVRLDDLGTVAGKIPDHWRDAVEDTISRLNENILQMKPGGTAIAIVTDCHWRNNMRRSPAIMRRIQEKCNLNYFFNLGDILYSGQDTKAAAVEEIQDFLNAFRCCRLPMLSVFGNHDTNADTRSRPDKYDPTIVLNRREHHNLVHRSFMQYPGLHWAYNTNGEPGAWWIEDDKYRYVGVMWFYDKDENYAQTLFDYSAGHFGTGSGWLTNRFVQFDPDVENWVAEAMDTEKQVIILTHGVYYEIDNPTGEKYKYSWFEEAFDAYKTKIRCVLQGHTHLSGLRWLWGSVPCVIMSADCLATSASDRAKWINTTKEQLLHFLTIDDDEIRIVKCGYYGVNRTITEDTASYGGDTSTEPR